MLAALRHALAVRAEDTKLLRQLVKCADALLNGVCPAAPPRRQPRAPPLRAPLLGLSAGAAARCRAGVDVLQKQLNRARVRYTMMKAPAPPPLTLHAPQPIVHVPLLNQIKPKPHSPGAAARPGRAERRARARRQAQYSELAPGSFEILLPRFVHAARSPSPLPSLLLPLPMSVLYTPSVDNS